MKLSPSEQAQLTHMQKIFYAMYGELPTDNMYYQYNMAKQKIYEQYQQTEISDKDLESAVYSAFEKLFPKKLNIDIGK